jgi:hypothetical protein
MRPDATAKDDDGQAQRLDSCCTQSTDKVMSMTTSGRCSHHKQLYLELRLRAVGTRVNFMRIMLDGAILRKTNTRGALHRSQRAAFPDRKTLGSTKR